jgi:hypothetical protein
MVEVAMASPVVVYFAGIGTVVAALTIGFGSAIMLTNTTPVQKVPPAAFAKREQPLEPQAPAPVTAVAPAQATESTDDRLAGLAPPLTASPVPKAEAVTRALALNPPPADATRAPAASEVVRPIQTARPVAPPDETSAVKSNEHGREKNIAAEKKPDRRVAERQQAITDKQPVADVEEEPEPRVAPELDRPTREGF